MSTHLDAWIDAYLDGELPAQQVQQIDAHLASCPSCRALVTRRRSLVTLLQEVPAAKTRLSESCFAAQVNRQAAANPAAPRFFLMAARFGWQLVPLGLLIGLVFLQTAYFATLLVGLLPGVSRVLASQATALTLLLPPPLTGTLAVLEGINPLSWFGWAGAWTVLFCLAYLCWLALWWASSRPATEAAGEHLQSMC